MKLEFEYVESNEFAYATRAKVPGGWIYAFREYSRLFSTCFVPDPPDQITGRNTVHLTADDLHELRRRPGGGY